MEKSHIVFTPNTPISLRQELEEKLGIPSTENPGIYLGIPSLWGKSKSEALGFVRDRILASLKNWKKQSLSQGGKEVLIKAVACAIPTYTMACFLLPKKLCQAINSACARFWWGQKEDERKIHWQSWMKMTMSKSLGGLGFKDLELFNKALLAKQAWRIIQEPDTLWVKLLKGIYFPNCSFMESGRGSRTSWTWSSILAGRDLIKDKSMWQVLDGESISIWNDSWILTSPGLKLQLQDTPSR